ncbi:indolepyruvate ferredoxin oxidoreductase subunit alpha [Neomoorella thermoacetica]|uniref:indolepyruvate ferredoxin oxidoreductase subunit alpha n=1 Tax=Neomoorella thermoacetica TaxID=1525 RepID=UPI0008FA6408|nr:indolepyruvate ferredoxin oxidoreductase subunit alpha [Moorella thermoacetica]OIQ11301.1 indolepyruvate ferredoxin oxidoreductase [Moorella thermoacetica]
MPELLMGNEAIARGALEAGIRVATAYPGTPASEIMVTLMRFGPEAGVYTEWSVNEKVAVEIAAGAAYAGARAMASMKQMGLNVAADAIMSLAYIGVKGGLVLVVADDPGPHSSQTEQDTRLFARFAKLPVLDPSCPREAYEMTKYAFDLSETLGLPVIVRPTTRTCHACQDVALGTIPPRPPVPGFEKDPRWVIMPSLSARQHVWLNQQQLRAGEEFANSPFNEVYCNGPAGVITSGLSYYYVTEAGEHLGVKLSLLKVGTPYPLPEKLVIDFLKQVERVLIVEEQEPVVEDQVIRLAWRHRLPVEIDGKHNGFLPREGEFNPDIVTGALAKFLAIQPAVTHGRPGTPPLPVRPPLLCAGCPHRGSFYAFKQAARDRKVIFTGDIGCYTLGAAPPLEAMDTCLCMGAGLGLAQGLARVQPDTRLVAFVGDSTFFHAGLPPLVNAVHQQTPIVVVVLDNETTAMTGHQPHPGLATDTHHKKIDISQVARACGVETILTADPLNLEETLTVANQALAAPGPVLVILSHPCPQVAKPAGHYQVDQIACISCHTCIKELGCPALRPDGNGVQIAATCTGCGLCSQVCPVAAIEEVL